MDLDHHFCELHIRKKQFKMNHNISGLNKLPGIVHMCVHPYTRACLSGHDRATEYISAQLQRNVLCVTKVARFAFPEENTSACKATKKCCPVNNENMNEKLNN